MSQRLTLAAFLAITFALGGCAGMTTAERVGTGAVAGAVGAAVLGANLGWGVTAGIAGGLLSRSVN